MRNSKTELVLYINWVEMEREWEPRIFFEA